MSFDRVVQRLEKSRKYKTNKNRIINAVRSTCPSCGGSSFKLNVSETAEGTLLIHCFGGCTAIDVLAAIGLDFADIHPENFMQSQTSKSFDRIKGWDWWSLSTALDHTKDVLLLRYLELCQYTSGDEFAKKMLLNTCGEVWQLANQVQYGKKAGK